MAGLKQDCWQNYVDGNWVDGGASSLTVTSGGRQLNLPSSFPAPAVI